MTENVQQETIKETVQAPEQAGAKTDPSELTINDLNAMKVIIDIASSRGAFKPAEMTVVGQTYTKLTTFLDAVAKQAEASKQGA
jgi:hypothetical protein